MGLATGDATATIGVKELAKAREYYETTLDLGKPERADQFMALYKCGNTRVQIYQSSFAGTNKATAATWQVDDIRAEIDDLKSRGVEFEHYDMPGIVMDGDVHNMGPEKAAWFKDPDGNILCLHQ